MEIALNSVNSVEDQLDDGFVKAYTNNLPFLSSSMLFNYFVGTIRQSHDEPQTL
jgi:hypothetical protein